jgi:hypothetical protein
MLRSLAIAVLSVLPVAALADADARAIAKYLKSLKPARRTVPGPFGPTETPTSFYDGFVVPAKK